MNTFDYYRAATLVEAFALMRNKTNYTLLAGGTDLLVKFNEKIMNPKIVLDLGLIKDMREIHFEGIGQVTLGALVTHTQVMESQILQKYAPALVKASSMVGSPQIRNRGTIGGNICNASPAADTVPALIALGAQIELTNEKQVRVIPLEELFLGPGRTVLQAGEILTKILLKALKPAQGSGFEKLGKRKALAISVVNTGVFIEVDPKTRAINEARIALGSVAPTPIRIKKAESLLLGKVLSPTLLKDVTSVVASEIKPIDDIRSKAEYRRDVAGELVKRAVEEAWNKASFLG